MATQPSPTSRTDFSAANTCLHIEIGGKEYFFDSRLLDMLNERTFRLPNINHIAQRAVQWGLTDNERLRGSLFNYADMFFTKTPQQQAQAHAFIAQYA